MKKKEENYKEQREQAQEIQLPEWVRIVNDYLREVKKLKRDKNG